MARKLERLSFVTISQFARRVGVTQQAVTQAIKNGRLVAFDAHGERVSPAFQGRKWLKPDLAAEDWHNRRRRYDNAKVQDDDLLAARTRAATLHGELLAQRRGRENGELIPKAKAMAAAKSLGTAIRRTNASIVGWSEEITAAAQNGGVGAVSSLLHVKFAELENSIGDLIAAAKAELIEGAIHDD